MKRLSRLYMSESILRGEAQWLREQGMITRAEEEQLKLMIQGDDDDFTVSIEIIKNKYQDAGMKVPFRVRQVEI